MGRERGRHPSYPRLPYMWMLIFHHFMLCPERQFLFLSLRYPPLYFRLWAICLSLKERLEMWSEIPSLILTLRYQCLKPISEFWGKYEYMYTAPESKSSPSHFSTEPKHDKTNKMTYTPSKDLDQPAQPHSLIRGFTWFSVGIQVPKESCIWWILWSDCTDTQA